MSSAMPGPAFWCWWCPTSSLASPPRRSHAPTVRKSWKISPIATSDATVPPPSSPPPTMKTPDPELMRTINRYHVIDVIRRHGPLARVEIVERTELSRATISAITGGLIEEGLITIHHVE